MLRRGHGLLAKSVREGLVCVQECACGLRHEPSVTAAICLDIRWLHVAASGELRLSREVQQAVLVHITNGETVRIKNRSFVGVKRTVQKGRVK